MTRKEQVDRRPAVVAVLRLFFSMRVSAMLAGGTTMASDLDPFLQRPIAHRGLHAADLPENSLAAFEAACEEGYPIELDVHVLRDGHLAVFHDVGLERMTGVRGAIADCSRDDLSRLRLDGSDERIPLLDDVLDLVGGRVPLVVELKTSGRPGACEHAARRCLERYAGPFAVQSFNPLTVAWFRREAPRFVRGLLACDFGGEPVAWHRRLVLRRLLLSPLAAPHYVGYALHCLPYWAPSLLRALGRPLIAWTIRSESDRLHAARVADNFIFESIRP